MTLRNSGQALRFVSRLSGKAVWGARKTKNAGLKAGATQNQTVLALTQDGGAAKNGAIFARVTAASRESGEWTW
jgi:hypothetical protein